MAYFGSYTETDPVVIASQGVEKFKKERFEVIIVDTSGRHKQESELFEEMVQIGNEVKPDMTVLVLDASIGKIYKSFTSAASDKFTRSGRRSSKPSFQRKRRFRCYHCNQDGWSCERWRGDLRVRLQIVCAFSVNLMFEYRVAVTKTPIIFLGVGEHLADLERFSPQPFISKLLGMGDVQGLMEHMQEMAAVNPDKQKEMAKKFEEGKLSIRDWREQLQNIMNMYVCLRFYLLNILLTSISGALLAR